ncbi:BadF/BadG/BcrA/BcrD ATPase family protein [Streptomyces tsukubensis]|uniref:BadF/BadG/BcrA/BcrD ATPase family protein n=1 Tax=Streptomyces tsukubensis TaxID=83656 RepID=UPI003450660B
MTHLLLVEGGGSRTWTATTTDGTVTATVEGPSTSPRSVGEQEALATLTRLILRLAGQGGPAGVVAAHGAASTTACAAAFHALVHRAVAAAGLRRVPVLVANDIVPHLLPTAGGDGGAVCAVICGTGTGYAARNDGAWARAGGREWLLSDEGGGHDLATHALRAVVRAGDGRGPATALTAAARTWTDHHGRQSADGAGPGEALFHTVHTNGNTVKPLVTSFAEHVVTAAAAGDPVAGRLLDGSARELAAGALAVTAAAGIGDGTPLTLVLGGSLLTGTRLLRDRFLAHAGLVRPGVTLREAAAPGPGLLRLAALWPDGDGLAALARVLPLHADAAPHRADVS